MEIITEIIIDIYANSTSTICHESFQTFNIYLSFCIYKLLWHWDLHYIYCSHICSVFFFTSLLITYVSFYMYRLLWHCDLHYTYGSHICFFFTFSTNNSSSICLKSLKFLHTCIYIMFICTYVTIFLLLIYILKFGAIFIFNWDVPNQQTFYWPIFTDVTPFEGIIY